MKIKKKHIALILIITLLVILYFIFDRHKPVRHTDENPAHVNVKILTLTKKDVNDFYETAGTIQAKTISVISSRIMGTINEIFVKLGDKVSAGQQLLLIDDKELQQQVNAAQAGYEGAKKVLETAQSNKALADTTYNRYKQLFDAKALSGQEMDRITNQKEAADLEDKRAQASVQSAEANLHQAKINLDYSRITSPVDGIVTQKNIDKGSMAMPGTALLTIEDVREYKIEVNVDERMANQFTISMPINVIVDSISRTFNADINEIVPSIDTSSRTFVLKAVIKDPNEGKLSNGLFARVLIPQKKINILVVPEKAVVRRGQLVGVYVLGEQDRIIFRMIRTSRTFGSDIEVISGLRENEKIIVDGINKVSEGQKIGSDSY